MLRKDTDPLIDARPYTDIDFDDLTVVASLSSPDTSCIQQESLDAAQKEIQNTVKTAVGEGNYEVFQAEVENYSQYKKADSTLTKRIRRSRLAMIGFGALAAVCFTKSAQHVAEGEFAYFPDTPITTMYYDLQECYDDPAGIQLMLDGEFSEPEPTDDASVENCIIKMADEMNEELRDSSKVVGPYADDISQLIEDAHNLAELPGNSVPAQLSEKQNTIQAAVSTREEQLSNDIGAALLYAIGGLGTLGPALFSLENVQARKRAKRLLLDLHEFKYQDVKNALEIDIRAVDDKKTEIPSHHLHSLNTGQDKIITFLPQGHPHKRRNILGEVSRALES